MRFAPKTQEEIDFENLLPKGEYDFEVVKAEDAVSKKGNEMIKINLKVFRGEGYQFVTDYLMEALSYQLRNFFETVNMIEAYNAGTVQASDIVGAAGKAKIDIEPAGEFPAKNVVKDYGVKKKVKPEDKGPLMNSFIEKAQEENELEKSEDIPF